MFDVGDEVVCIDDESHKIRFAGEVREIPVPIKKGDQFVVLAVYPSGTKLEDAVMSVTCRCDCIGIGMPFFRGFDTWPAERFRKVIKLDTKESLCELINIANTAPAKPETVDA